MKAAIYCRVSTEDQEKEGTSLQTQLEACLDYCKKKKYEVDRQFSETCSGLTLERSKLTELRELLRSGNINVVVVYCLDRLSRNATHGVILRDEFDKQHVSLESVTEDIDKTPLGEAITYLRGTFAQLEAEKIRERTMRGKRAYVDQGKFPTGTGKGLYGYKWDKATKRRVPIEYEARIVEKIFKMLAEGNSRFRVAETLNNQGVPTKSHGKWHPLTIQRLATNEAYAGVTYYYQTRGSRKTTLVKQSKENWRALPDVTPAIISREFFDRVQKRLQQQKEARQNVETRHYLLRGYAYCGYCGSPLIGTCLNKKIMYYHCRGTWPTSTRKAICDARYIRAEMLETFVWEKVKAIISQPDVALAEIRRQSEIAKAQNDSTSLDREMKVIQRRLREYPDQEKRLINALKTGMFTQDYVLDEINRIKSTRQADLLELQELKQAKINLSNLEKAEVKLSEFYAEFRRRVEHNSSDEKRLAFEALGLRVKATSENAEITTVIPVNITSTQSSDSLLTTAQTSASQRECSCRRRRA